MVTPRYVPFVGGTERHVQQVAARLASRGVSVTVLTGDPTGRLPRVQDVGGVAVRRFPAWPGRGDLYLTPGLYRAIGSGEWDVIHLQGVHTLIAPLTMMAARRWGKTYVVSFHSGGHSSQLRSTLRPLQWWGLRGLLASADQLIAVSEFEANVFRRTLRLPTDRFVIIPNGADDCEQPPQPAVGRFERRTILSIGRLERYKGHHRAIAALPTVLEVFPDAQLVIVGQGPYEKELRALAAESRVIEHIEFRSFGPDQRAQLSTLMARSHLTVLLSEYESQGIAALEAMTHGCPVLVADNSALRELAERGMAARVSLDCSDLAIGASMVESLQAPGVDGAELPSWDVAADALVGVYRRVAGATCGY